MSSNNEQNGRQPPLPNRPPLPSDPRAGIVSEQQRPLCRKYVWGTCTKSVHCRFRHDLDIEEMKIILKFCHDFQNKQGCGRVDCTYLHASKEEETLFREKNEIPRVLLERYAALAKASNNMQNFEGVPQMMMFVTAPPPPPPPPTQPPPTQAGPVFPSIQQLPPPPPPPTIPPTSIVQSAPVFTGPPPQGTPVVFPISQQPPPSLPPLFDASRPPPPIPSQTKNGAVKRRIECEAGPSKVRKPEGAKVAENHCENCVQRELRIDVYKQEMDKIHCEMKYQSLVYKKKLKDYENAKEILRALVSSELFRILENYVEGGPPQVQDILAQLSTTPIMSLIELIISSRNSMVDSTPSTSLRLDDPLSALSSISRITNPINNASSDLLHTLIEVLRNSNTERETRPELDVRTSTPAITNSNVNGFNRFSNGQLTEASSPSVPSTKSSRFPTTPASAAPRSFPSVNPAGPSGVSTSVTAAPAPPAPAYPPYHPCIPPPTNRPYYTQPYSGPAVPQNNNAMVNMPYHSARVGTPQMTPRPPAPTMAPSMPPNFNQYMMGRYPHPPQYYPPYQ